MRITAFDLGIKNFAFYTEENIAFGRKGIIDMTRKIELSKNNLILSLIQFLNSIKEELRKSDVFIIEKQYYNRGGGNIKCLKLESSLFTYLTINFENSRVEIMSPRLRNSICGFGLTYRQRKNMSILFAKEYFTENNDVEMKSYFETFEKKDDIADCVIMIELFNKNEP